MSTYRGASGVRSALVAPALVLTVFFAVPFGLMVMVSFFARDPGGFYTPTFSTGNYERFFSLFYARMLGFSLGLSALVSALCVALGTPFTYRLSRMARRRQVIWLVAMLAVLSLSEVIIGFAWSTLLSRTAGVTNLLVLLGLMDTAQAWTPSFGAVLAGMVYQAFPYTVLVLYPAISRLDPALAEAGRTLGASPVRAFLTVVVPALRASLLAAFVIVFVFALGAYLLPQLLGRPEHWTLSVLITDQAIYQSNMPFAAAMAVVLMVTSLALILLASRIGRQDGGPR